MCCSKILRTSGAIWSKVGAVATILLVIPVNLDIKGKMGLWGLTKDLNSETIPFPSYTIIAISIILS